MHFLIHHLGKAGEVLAGLPVARLLKQYHPTARITWIVLDLYRDALGDCPYLDAVETIPTASCQNLYEVGQRIYDHRTIFFHYALTRIDPAGLHLDLNSNYLLLCADPERHLLHRDPFYLQFFKHAVALCPGADLVKSWTLPDWQPTAQAARDAAVFEKSYGGGPVVIFSPYIADQRSASDNQSDFAMPVVHEELRKLGLPVVCTGTKWDAKDFPSWMIDGYAPTLSLGGLFYLIKHRASLLVSPNSGIGFAAHWLGAPVLMIDNRTGWKQQVEVWKSKNPYLKDDALPDEQCWPPFMKECFPAPHLGPAPFEQILWSPEGFDAALERLRPSIRVMAAAKATPSDLG